MPFTSTVCDIHSLISLSGADPDSESEAEPDSEREGLPGAASVVEKAEVPQREKQMGQFACGGHAFEELQLTPAFDPNLYSM